MKSISPSRSSCRNRVAGFAPSRHAAFTLIEIALSLGIVGFALVGIVGAIPLALNNGRLSIAQSRAASVANTIFSGIRAQPFSKVQFLDDAATATTPSGTGSVNLNAMVTNTTANPPIAPSPDGLIIPASTSAPLQFYAYFDEVPSAAPDTTTVDSRRLHFPSLSGVATPPPKLIPPINVVYYTITLRFSNNPPGTLAPYQTTPTATVSHAQANAIEASISESDRPNDVFHFSSTIANRSE